MSDGPQSTVNPVPPDQVDGVETFFGRRVTDPYRWLETPSTRTNEWLRRQEQSTEAVIASIPALSSIRTELLATMTASDSIKSVRTAAGTTFYLRTRKGAREPQLIARELGGKPEKILFTPESGQTVDHLAPSHDARFIAFGIASGGSEDNTIRIVDVARRSVLTDRVDHIAYPSISWMPGKPAFFYTKFPHFLEADSGKKYSEPVIAFHTVGTSQDADRVVLGGVAGDLPGTSSEDAPEIYTSAGSTFMLAIVRHGTRSDVSIFAASLVDPVHWTKVVGEEDAVSNWELVGSDLYVISRRDSPLGRVAQTSLERAGTLKVVLAETERPMVNIVATRKFLYVVEQGISSASVQRIDLKTKHGEAVRLPFDATINATLSDPSGHHVVLELEGWADSPRWYSLADDEIALRSAFPDQESRSVPGAQVQHLFATSRDGTRVPLTVIAGPKADLTKPNPVMLLGYGAYEISVRPSFEAKRAVWFDHGGVIAYAHVRGGGELGRQWHQSAVRANKQRSVDDYIACAETLISHGIATSSLIGGVGHSAGGLLVGAAMVQRPDLFRAISINSGIVDVLRFLSVGAGPDNADEFGHLDVEEEFRVLQHLDVYQQVQAAVSYPALLVSVGMNDPRVPFWQGAKLVAKVQDESALKHPAIFVARRDTGHVGASLAQVAETSAVQYGFLLWQLGHGAQTPDGSHAP